MGKMNNLSPSRLYDQNTFYNAFLKDLRRTKSLVIIESPFITKKRMQQLLPILKKLRDKDIRIIVNTKPFNEHDAIYREQVIWAVGVMQDMGIDVLLTCGHHRKLAIIDDILWEGSLNILSQNDSCEIMRRIKSKKCVDVMVRFIKIFCWI
jgi:hypothetical protein